MPEEPSSRRSLRETLAGNPLGLGITSFWADVAGEMMYPLLPAFLTVVLGANAAFLGLVEGVAESTASLLKLAGGWLSDRLGVRKPLAAWGYGVAAVARPLLALVTAPWQLLIARAADRAGKGIRTAPRDALLAGSVDADRRGVAFGFQRAMDNAGAVVGPLVAAGLMALWAGGYRRVFALSVIPGVLSVLAILRLTREVGPRAEADGHAETGRAGADRAARPARPRLSLGAFGTPFRGYLGAVFLFTLGNSSDAFLLLRAGQLGVATAAIPLLWAAFNLSKTAWNLPGGLLSDRLGPRRSILIGWGLYALVYVGFAVAGRTWHAWALFLVYGLFYGLTEAPERAYVAQMAPEGLRSTAYGTFHFAVGLAALPASLLFGAVWELASPEAAFLTGAGVGVAAAALLLLLTPSRTARA
ncbi:MAG: MFS transporter [Candidatus Palauibacterales bacterium]|nr:MFS transporter [Candidatus Palauibacterales bacterium]MDP2529065.1 MFS transporter [Candidatus Palauibacterales bacterium]MDP2583884.1 MFS transporter [Candidatus Palauibacterales bacterium]